MNKPDIIVVGAGIAGTSAAALLAEHYSVLVLEMEAQPGHHSTGRSAATWAPYYGPPVIQTLTALSGPALNSPSPEFSNQPFTSPRGQMVFTTRDSANSPEESTSEMRLLSKSQARDKVGLLKTDMIDLIWYTDGLVNIDVDLLHQAFMRQLKNNHGTIVCNQRVNALNRQGRNWQVVTDGGTYSAPIVINAAGAWADTLATLAGIPEIGLQPKRRTAALVPYKGDSMQHWPLIFNAAEDFYCIPFGGSLLISPADETPVDPHDAWPDDTDVATGIDRFQRVIDYDIEHVSHRWAGLRTFAPDGVPVVGYERSVDGFFWLAGQGGYGIQTSVAMATLTCGLIREAFDTDQEQYSGLSKALTPSRFNTRE